MQDRRFQPNPQIPGGAVKGAATRAAWLIIALFALLGLLLLIGSPPTQPSRGDIIHNRNLRQDGGDIRLEPPAGTRSSVSSTDVVERPGDQNAPPRHLFLRVLAGGIGSPPASLADLTIFDPSNGDQLFQATVDENGFANTQLPELDRYRIHVGWLGTQKESLVRWEAIASRNPFVIYLDLQVPIHIELHGVQSPGQWFFSLSRRPYEGWETEFLTRERFADKIDETAWRGYSKVQAYQPVYVHLFHDSGLFALHSEALEGSSPEVPITYRFRLAPGLPGAGSLRVNVFSTVQPTSPIRASVSFFDGERHFRGSLSGEGIGSVRFEIPLPSSECWVLATAKGHAPKVVHLPGHTTSWETVVRLASEGRLVLRLSDGMRTSFGGGPPVAYVDQLDYWLEPPALPQRSKISIGALGDEIRAIRIQDELIPLAIRDGEMRELEGPRPSGTVLLSNRIVEIHLAGTSARSLRLFYMLDGRYYLAQSFQKLGEEGSDFFSGPAEIPEGLPRFRIIDNSYGRELYVSSTQWRHGEGGDSIEITAY